jgi:GT2 family glycosyltransferase
MFVSYNMLPIAPPSQSSMATAVSAQPPAVGIGILNWNGRAFLEQFLPFLYRVTYPNLKLYVIDNASTDDSLAFLRANHPQVNIIETGGNYGVPGGYNRGFAQMNEPYLLMLNSDVEVEPGFLEPLVALMAADAQIAMVQSTLLAHTRRQHYEYGGAAGGFIDVLGYTFCRGRMFATVEQATGQYATAPVFWAGGACALIRKTAYQRVGGMYEWFFMHFEEVDLCWRFRSAGFSVWCCSQSLAWHVGGGTLSYQSPQKTFYNFRNNLVMMARNSPRRYLFWWLPARLAFDVAAAALYGVGGHWGNAGAVARGWWAFLRWWWRAQSPDFAAQKLSLRASRCVYGGAVAVGYYFQGKRYFSSIMSSPRGVG